MIDFITGEKFAQLADNKSVFYCNTHELSKFKAPRTPFVMTTHNSDCGVSANIMPDNLVHWFAQNVECKDSKIESLPIGLENAKWFPTTHKKEKMETMLSKQRMYRNLVYMNFNLKTHPDRQVPYLLFHREPWVAVERGQNGLGFDSYLDNIYNHKFVLSPRGNGIDTHRTWECLYMGVIPIEKRNINNQFYTDLPICFVDDWWDITEDFLFKEYERIKSKKWNMERIYFNYWKNKINAFKK